MWWFAVRNLLFRRSFHELIQQVACYIQWYSFHISGRCKAQGWPCTVAKRAALCCTATLIRSPPCRSCKQHQAKSWRTSRRATTAWPAVWICFDFLSVYCPLCMIVNGKEKGRIIAIVRKVLRWICGVSILLYLIQKDVLSFLGLRKQKTVAWLALETRCLSASGPDGQLCSPGFCCFPKFCNVSCVSLSLVILFFLLLFLFFSSSISFFIFFSLA